MQTTSFNFNNAKNLNTSKEWFNYFNHNLEQKRIDWTIPPTITKAELKSVLKSLQAWQLGETSDGSNLIAASIQFAKKINDP